MSILSSNDAMSFKNVKKPLVIIPTGVHKTTFNPETSNDWPQINQNILIPKTFHRTKAVKLMSVLNGLLTCDIGKIYISNLLLPLFKKGSCQLLAKVCARSTG